MSECDMQPIYRINDILLPRQNWVTDQSANARGCVNRVDEVQPCGGYAVEIYLPGCQLYFCWLLCNVQTKRDLKDCSVFCFTETWLDPTIQESAVQRVPGLFIYSSD